MMAVASAKYDFSRFGFEVARASPRQADVIIIAGTIVNKMAPVLKRLYDQMADPKYVIAMGACAISGGPFFYNTYSVVKGADHVIPVDVYVAGCPPRPEALLHALITLTTKNKKRANERTNKDGQRLIMSNDELKTIIIELLPSATFEEGDRLMVGLILILIQKTGYRLRSNCAIMILCFSIIFFALPASTGRRISLWFIFFRLQNTAIRLL